MSVLIPVYFAFAYTIDSVNKYAWSYKIGWINFAPANGSVLVTDSKLTGYIWSANEGWINLSPAKSGVLNDGSGNLSGYAWGQETGYINFSGVVINSAGKFTGSATGDAVGTISFDCLNCSVTTDWRPASVVAPAATTLTTNNGGGILTVSQAPAPPQNKTFLAAALQQLKQFIESIFPKATLLTPQIGQPFVIPEIAPLAMKGTWNLLPINTVSRFLFAPLPSELTLLADKFPSLKKTFKETGIVSGKDLLKLKGVRLTLPGLIENINPMADLSVPMFPLKLLSFELQNKIPTDVVFTRSAGEKLDFNTNVSFDESGRISSEINVIAGTPLHFIVRPSKSASRVTGYLIFQSRTVTQNPGQNYSRPDYRLAEISAATRYLSLDNQEMHKIPAPEYQKLASETPKKPAQNLVLLTFNYNNTGNGIYNADIQAPVVDGNYEVLTRIEYPDAAPTEITFTAVIDPEGYVYEQLPEGQVRIANAAIALFWLNPQTGKYEIWPAADYNQKNPQTTDERGTYAFLIPTGKYYLAVEAKGFGSFKGDVFEVQRGATGIHINVELYKLPWYQNILNLLKPLF